jgi:hypothetical protein
VETHLDVEQDLIARAQLLWNFQCDTQGLIQGVQFLRGQTADKIGEDRLGETDQFVTMKTAVVLETFLNADEYLSGQTIMNRINRGTYHCGEA